MPHLWPCMSACMRVADRDRERERNGCGQLHTKHVFLHNSSFVLLAYSMSFSFLMRLCWNMLKKNVYNTRGHSWGNVHQMTDCHKPITEAVSNRCHKKAANSSFCIDYTKFKVHIIPGEPIIIWFKIKANNEFIFHNCLRQNSTVFVHICYLQIYNEALNTRHNEIRIIPTCLLFWMIVIRNIHYNIVQITGNRYYACTLYVH